MLWGKRACLTPVLVADVLWQEGLDQKRFVQGAREVQRHQPVVYFFVHGGLEAEDDVADEIAPLFKEPPDGPKCDVHRVLSGIAFRLGVDREVAARIRAEDRAGAAKIREENRLEERERRASAS